MIVEKAKKNMQIAMNILPKLPNPMLKASV